MSWTADLYRSAVGKKAVMAVTGVVLFLYVVLHMIGNLKLYQGPEKYNEYAHWLREMGAPALPGSAALWIVRIVLLLALALHVLAAYQLTVMNRHARPVAYSRRDAVQAGYAARTMRATGVIVLLFVFYHLAHFTWGWEWAHRDFVAGDVYHNVIAGFGVWWVSAMYIAAQLALGLHLFHGLWSMFQSVGWDPGKGRDWRRVFAQASAWIIVIGNISFPVAVLAGLVGESP